MNVKKNTKNLAGTDGPVIPGSPLHRALEEVARAIAAKTLPVKPGHYGSQADAPLVAHAEPTQQDVEKLRA